MLLALFGKPNPLAPSPPLPSPPLVWEGKGKTFVLGRGSREAHPRIGDGFFVFLQEF